jgi:hypothetical protein
MEMSAIELVVPLHRHGAVRRGTAPYGAKRVANKPLGDVAVAAIAQNGQAQTALKLVKDTRRLGQRY